MAANRQRKPRNFSCVRSQNEATGRLMPACSRNKTLGRSFRARACRPDCRLGPRSNTQELRLAGSLAWLMGLGPLPTPAPAPGSGLRRLVPTGVGSGLTGQILGPAAAQPAGDRHRWVNLLSIVGRVYRQRLNVTAKLVEFKPVDTEKETVTRIDISPLVKEAVEKIRECNPFNDRDSQDFRRKLKEARLG